VKRWVVQFVVGKAPSGVDECDLDWREIKGESFPVDGGEALAWQAAEQYDRDFDHRFTHRAALVEVEAAPPARPIVKAPAPAVKAPVVEPAAVKPPAREKAAKKAPRLEGSPLPVKFNRQLTEFVAQRRFEDIAYRLGLGIAKGVDFEILLPLIESLEAHLGNCGNTLLAKRYAEQLAGMRALAAAGKPTLRVIK
jgi:hypothetical protein